MKLLCLPERFSPDFFPAATRLGQYYKSFFLGHYIGFFPWHYAI
jgi:hypothetical protein